MTLTVSVFPFQFFLLSNISPSEFWALEMALGAISSFLAAHTTELETAYPAFYQFMSEINGLNLDRVHKLKDTMLMTPSDLAPFGPCMVIFVNPFSYLMCSVSIVGILINVNLLVNFGSAMWTTVFHTRIQ